MKKTSKEMQEFALRMMKAERLAKSGDIMSFTCYTNPVYQVGWHHQRIGDLTTRFVRKEISRLMIFAPPQHGKSEIVSRRLPPLIHGLYPDDKILACSYNGDLASDMTIDVQRIMDTVEYKRLFPHSQITPEGKSSNFARNSNEHELIPVQLPDKYWKIPKGSYISAGVDGAFTGRTGNWLLIDDPYKNRAAADSKANRDMIFKNYTSTLKTRMLGEGQILIMHTRWHEDDLAANLLALADKDPNADKWTVLILKAIRDDMSDPEDPRELGEALWKERFPMKILLANKANSERDFSSLYQQSPIAEGGNIVKSQWLENQYYKNRPERFDEVIQSWDFAVKGKETSSFVVGQVWGRKGLDKYLLDQFRGRVDFSRSCEELLKLTRKWPQAHKKYVEDKANGPAVISTLKKIVTGLEDVPPRGDKVARLRAVSTEFSSGRVWLPDISIAPWISDYVTELISFPSSTNNDQVDATTQALDNLRKSGPVHLPLAGHGGGTLY